MSWLLIVGAGGYGRSVAEAALLTGVWTNIVFSDANWPNVTEVFGWWRRGGIGRLVASRCVGGLSGKSCQLGYYFARCCALDLAT